MIIFLILISILSAAQVKKDLATKNTMNQKRTRRDLIHVSRMMEIKHASLEKLNSLNRLTKFHMFLIKQFLPMDDERRLLIMKEKEEIRLRQEDVEMNDFEKRFGSLSIEENNNENNQKIADELLDMTGIIP